LRVRSQAGWSPDGGRLVFSALALGLDEVYVMSRGGSGLMRLTRGTEGIR
jgi:hypothetical protein